jgi:subtilisin family serine protease
MNTFQSLASRYDDPYFDLQGSLRLLDVENAHTMATGKGVLVAVIDSSVDRAHPDLRASVSMQRDLVGGRRLRQHPEVHGTAVAGVIASAANNAVGIIGVAPDARIAALRACWSERDTDSTALCSSFTLAQALELALELEPDIINLSVAGPEDPLLGLLIDRATERGIAVVAAEETFDTRLSFPASHRGVLAARSAADQRDDGAESSVPAPSSEVLTTTPDREYAFLSGSSLAAAHISGVVALLLQRYPDLTHGELLERLHASMMTEHGAVSVNACRALAGQATEEAHCLQP